MVRYFAAKLYYGESYYMQIDAHSFFAQVRKGGGGERRSNTTTTTTTITTTTTSSSSRKNSAALHQN